MGRPKDRISMSDGRCMIQYVLDVMLTVCNEVVIAGPEIPEKVVQNDRITFVKDNFPGYGPLSGIEAILSSGVGTGYLIAACDQPLLNAEIFKLVIPETRDKPCFFDFSDEGLIQPFPGYYPVTWLPEIRDSLRRNRRALKSLISESTVIYKPKTAAVAWCLQSINTEEDLENLAPFSG